MRSSRRWAYFSALSLVLAACTTGGAIVLEPQQAVNAAVTTLPASTAAKPAPEPTVMGTVITQTTTTLATTTTVSTLVALPEIEGPEAHDFSLELSDGSTFILGDQRRPVLLVFWAEWCPSCRDELPIIDSIAVDYGERITVLTVARESSEDVVTDLVAELMPSGLVPWGMDDELEISSLYSLPGVPVTVLALGGVEAKRWLGPVSDADVRSALDECLALLEA